MIKVIDGCHNERLRKPVATPSLTFQTKILVMSATTVNIIVDAVSTGDTAAANAAIASLSTATTASLESAQVTVGAAAETAAVRAGVYLPENITVIETVE